MLPVKSTVGILLFSSQYALAIPQLSTRTIRTCAPTLVTLSQAGNKIAAPVVTVSHSCYAYTATTLQSNNAACPTFNATTCGPALQCVLMSNKTITVPKSDYCCPITTTTTVGGACKSCQRGCATSTRTFYVTEGSASATTSSASVTYKNHEATTSCTSTLLTAMPFELGPTSTAHPSTVRRTSTLDCGGCGSVIVMDIDGLGPEARFLTTVTASSAKTIAAYVCSATPA